MRIVIVAAVLALLGCDSRRLPGPGSWADLDASAPDARVPIGGGAGGGGGGGRRTAPPDCGARVLVVVDRSGSMAAEWMTADGPVPRWQVARDALHDALEPLADRLTAGAIFFPSGAAPEPGVCAPVDPIEDQLTFRDGPTFLEAWLRI